MEITIVRKVDTALSSYDSNVDVGRIAFTFVRIISSLCPRKAMPMAVKMMKAKWLMLIIHQNCANWFESIKVVPIGLEVEKVQLPHFILDPTVAKS